MILKAQRPGVHGAHHHRVLTLDADSDHPRALVGGKGRALGEIARLGLPVPPAFCLTIAWCRECAADPHAVLDEAWPDVLDGLKALQEHTGATFGGGERPLLVAVRSSGVTSMPGMLETVLDVGIDDAVADALAARYSPGFARDTLDRFRRGYRRAVHVDPPAYPYEQLRGAMAAVLESWTSDRVLAYRTHHHLDEPDRVAVLVQAMVFGNLDSESGTGVLFTRNPATGSPEPFGEWLPTGQGDDVVSGARDCETLDVLARTMPDVHDELLAAGIRLEQHGADVQDVEFTVEAGKLWLLQSRVAQRSARAAVRLALALHDEGVIDEAEVLARVTPAQLRAAMATTLAPETRLAARLLATGLPASPGVASGLACTTSDAAVDASDAGQDVILVRPTTSPDDMAGMVAARGVVTEVGGATSHAAIVARELGLPAVVGCGGGLGAVVDGTMITVDGDSGEVRAGALEPTAWSAADTPELHRLDDIARRVSPLRVHADGDHPAMDASEDAVAGALSAGLVDVRSPEPLVATLVAARRRLGG
ncbi:pyruvate, phosphate dikinase [Mycolicibacterium lacusdiani]|uniref:pyruvate, phosphate dikinase n=1 Tax=Mycolicibacterium lacusdiani TaxID=2895283 RepID=UPI001F29BA21|nr:pyruvate, phosphate dikinase [Mycolicibacterium lacusdiani]